MSDSNLATWVGGKLAGGAVGAVGSSLFTYGLCEAGIPLPSAGDTSGQLSAIQQTLSHIEGVLTDIENQVSSVEARLEAAIKQSDFNERSADLESLIENIFSLTRRYMACVNDAVTDDKNSDPGSKDRVAKAKIDILQEIESQLINQPSTIHNIVAGKQGTTPLYETYADAVRGAHRFLSYLDSDAVQARIDYYQSAQYLQLMLVVAYCNAGRGLPEDRDAAIKIYTDNIANENRFQVIPIPEGIVIDQKTRLAVFVEDLPQVSGKDSWGSSHHEFILGVMGWRPALLWNLISPTKAFPIMNIVQPPNSDYQSANSDFGIFTGYDSQGGSVSPSQWLMNNGCYKNLGAIRLWASVGSPSGCWALDITDEETLNNPQLLSGNDVAHNLLVHSIGVDHQWGSNFDDSLLIANRDAAGAQTKPQFDPVVFAQLLMTDVVKDDQVGSFNDLYKGTTSSVNGGPMMDTLFRKKAWLYRMAVVIIVLQEGDKLLISPNFSAVRESFQSKAFAACPEQNVSQAVEDLNKIFYGEGRRDEEIISNRRARVAAWLNDVHVDLGPFVAGTVPFFMRYWIQEYFSVRDLVFHEIAPWYERPSWIP